MNKPDAESTVAALALAGLASLASVGAMESPDAIRRRPGGKVRPHRCRDMKKKRKRRMAKESRRRNRG